MTETLGNAQLESEYLSSLFLKQNLLTSEYVQLRIELAKTPIVSVSEDFDNLLVSLQNLVVSDFGLLEDSVMDAYIRGNKPTVLQLVNSLYIESSNLLPIMQQQNQQKELDMVMNIDKGMESSADFYEMGDVLKSQMNEQSGLEEIRNNIINLVKLRASMRTIIDLYDSHSFKQVKKQETPKSDKNYKMYIIDLQNNLTEVVSDPLVAVTLGKAIEALGITNPKNNLDEYKQEIFDNVLLVLTSPKDFYKDCETEKIVSSDVGTIFSSTYPEFYQKFLNMYIDEYESMDYQEQINFRKCFALPEDNSELLAMCNNYIKMSYT